MGIIRKSEDQHFVYEHTELGILVAVGKEDTAKIKSFWKTNKAKTNPANDTIEGYKFVFDEEQESLKIDFEKLEKFEIKFLSKYA
jgi:hypothetical protein